MKREPNQTKVTERTLIHRHMQTNADTHIYMHTLQGSYCILYT